jgi:hypothetical protein
MILRAAFPSFILIPAGYLIYGWTTQKGVAVYAPLAGLFICKYTLICNFTSCSHYYTDSLGQMCAFAPSSVYLVDSKPGRSASAVAINNCVRSIIAAITTIFSSSSLNAVGPGILFTILAVLNIINIITVLLVMMYGKKWRTNFEERTGTGKPITHESDLQELAIINSMISSIR